MSPGEPPAIPSQIYQPRKSIAAVLQKIWGVARVVLSIGLIGWLIFGFDWSSVPDAFTLIPWWVLLSGLVLFLLAQILAAWRLRLLLSAQSIGLTYLDCLRLTFIGLFANNFLPSTVGGDVYKMVDLARARHGKTKAALSIAFDRLINMVAILCFLPTLLTLPNISKLNLPMLLIWVLTLATLVIIVVWITVPRLRKLQSSAWVDTPSRWAAWLLGVQSRITAMITGWISRPWVLTQALLISLGVVVAGFLSVAIQAMAMRVPAGLIQIVAVFVLVYFIALLPISLNGLGLQEISLIYLLGTIGMTQSQSAVLALLSRAFLMLSSILGGLWMLAKPTVLPATRASED